jgi:serine/threonine protein kinase
LLLDLVVPPTPPPPASAATEGPSQLDYRSPEQLAGKTLSGRSNVFSLGVLLYRLLAGQLPPLPVSEWDIFEHKGTAREMPLNELRPGLTEATYTAVRDSIWQKEWSRYETAADQQKALELGPGRGKRTAAATAASLAAAGQTCQPAKDSQDCGACFCGDCFAAFGDAVGTRRRAAAGRGSRRRQNR